MSIKLTKKQTAIFRFLRDSINSGGPPTIRQIGIKFKIKSPNGVMCHLKALKKKGVIEWEGKKSRTIRITGEGLIPVEGRVHAGQLSMACPVRSKLDIRSWRGGKAFVVADEALNDQQIRLGDYLVMGHDGSKWIYREMRN